jgi:hypothetical protein
MDKLLIDTCHRVGKKIANKERTVIVAFCQRSHLNEILRNRGKLAKYKFDGKHILSFMEVGTKEMVNKKREAWEVRNKLIEKFKQERINKKVQLRGWDKIKVGDEPPEHYTKIALKYHL